MTDDAPRFQGGHGKREGQPLERALDTVQLASRRGEGAAVAVISVIALVFSAISLYETVLKQARFAVYLPEVMHYARDPSGAEVLVLPLTIANHGARDGAAVSLRLTALNRGPGERADYAAAYFGANPRTGKAPFAPIAVPGRGSYTGAVLFYPKPGGARSALVAAPGDYRFRLSIETDTAEDYGFFDRLLRAPPPSPRFTATLPWLSNPDLDAGRTIPMSVGSVELLGAEKD